MNIFVLDKDPAVAARQHNDKHVVKMILESAQLLSTAHRMVDGVPYVDRTANNHRIQRWRHPGVIHESMLLKASHVNHPCNVWVRSHEAHYQWLFALFAELNEEYTRRYHKEHAYSVKRHPALYSTLGCTPFKLLNSTSTPTAPPQAMPDIYKVTDPADPWGATVEAYHRYYKGAKTAFSTWKNTAPPQWFAAI